MRTCCPECDAAIELEDSAVALLTCPSCGTRLGMSEGDMLTETVSMKSGGYEMVAHFELLRKVGSGTFGDVFQARDTQLDRIVAVKLLRRGIVDDQSRAMFLREGRSAAQLRHPQIVTVYGLGSDGDTCYIASEFIEGVPLSKYLQSRRFEAREAAELCAAIADALAHAHAAGVIHRDLKPSNIMLDGQRRPHVMDFGLAKRETGDVTLTVDGQLLGTVPYMPPEQASGKAHQADRRSDIYSLGVVLYELLTGSYPFRGSTESILFQILHDEPAPPRKTNPAVPRDLQTICLKALSKDRAHRYDSAEEMAADLRAFLAGAPIKARPAGRLERSWRWIKRKPLVAGACAAMLIAVVSLAVAMRERSLRPAPLTLAVSIFTEPPGAEGVFVPLNPDTGEPDPSKKVRFATTPATLQLAPGEYLVVARKERHGFHEVYRTVPQSGEDMGGEFAHSNWQSTSAKAVDLPSITIPRERREGMTPFSGGRFRVGNNRLGDVPEHERTIAPFLLDCTEVTVADFRSIIERTLQPQLADAGAGDFPVVNVSYELALEFAEKTGKRLPSEFEYEFAATNGGTTKFPWGDDGNRLQTWTFGPVRSNPVDVTATNPPVFGLYSNVAEWTDSSINPYPGQEGAKPGQSVLAARRQNLAISRVVRGADGPVIAAAPNDVAKSEWSGPCARLGVIMNQTGRGIGFRCARSLAPRFLD